MILVVSNARDVTADFLQERLQGARIPHARLNSEELARLPFTFSSTPDNGTAARFAVGGEQVDLGEVRAIYYRRPIPPELPSDVPDGWRDWMENETRRAWAGALTAWPAVRWMNHPLFISGANYKPEQIARARRFGLSVPPTIVTTEPAVARAFCESNDWRIVVKPVGHGEILGATEDEDRIVYTNLVEPDDAAFDHVTYCPTMFQHALEKDVDLRVTVAGDALVAVALHSQEREVSRVDCRRDNMAGMRYALTELPGPLHTKVIDFVRSYGLLYAALDFVVDPAGEVWFLEINPAGQWAWLEQLADAPISEAIIRCLIDER